MDNDTRDVWEGLKDCLKDHELIRVFLLDHKVALSVDSLKDQIKLVEENVDFRSIGLV